MSDIPIGVPTDDPQFVDLMTLYHDRPVPTIFADGVIGIASSAGIDRVTLTTQVFNPERGVTRPRIEPVAVLAMPREAFYILAKQIVEATEMATAAAMTDAPAE